MSRLGSPRLRYTIIGWAVSRFAWPAAKKAMRSKAQASANGMVESARRNPARTSVAIGAIVGAAGWVVARALGSGGDDGGGGGGDETVSPGPGSRNGAARRTPSRPRSGSPA